MSDLAQCISRLLPKDQAALVGVSGGVDSMVLLHLLAGNRKVHVAHLNHQLRGRSSDADERLVRRTAEKLNLPCHVEKGVVCRDQLSLEMAARHCRHEFYARLARKLGITKIALAHHADDQVELFFLRLLRGAGPEGLAGMAETAPSFVDPSLTIVRPLLGVMKAELRAYAARHKLPFREDATNAATSILRNRVRHKLLPLLAKDYQRGLAKNVLRVMELLKTESDFVAGQAATARQAFSDLPVPLQRRRLQKELYAAGIESSFDLVEHLRLNPGIPITVGPEQLVARNPAGDLKVSTPPGWNADSVSARVIEAGTVVFSGITVSWGQTGKNCECFDADAIGGTIILRHWRPGDRFQPIGMSGPVKLQDLFTNLKIPRGQRHQRVVATTVAGEIFWVEGLRIGEKFKIEPFTARRLKWAWQRHETC